MVVVDSSALIPLAWIGRLDLIEATFDDIRTPAIVKDEVLTEGKRGTAALDEFLDSVTIEPTPNQSEHVAGLEGIAVADAAVILRAETTEQVLLANDKGLLEVARSHGVDCWWVTTLLLHCAKTGIVDADEGPDILYELVDEGMNLHPQVYAKVQKKLEEIES